MFWSLKYDQVILPLGSFPYHNILTSIWKFPNVNIILHKIRWKSWRHCISWTPHKSYTRTRTCDTTVRGLDTGFSCRRLVFAPKVLRMITIDRYLFYMQNVFPPMLLDWYFICCWKFRAFRHYLQENLYNFGVRLFLRIYETWFLKICFRELIV